MEGKILMRIIFLLFFSLERHILKCAYYRPHPPAEMKVAVRSLISCGMSCLCGKRYIIKINYFSCITELCSHGVFIHTHIPDFILFQIQILFLVSKEIYVYKVFSRGLRSQIRFPLQTVSHWNHSLTSISNSTTNLCNNSLHYDKLVQYCPLVGLFLHSISAVDQTFAALSSAATTTTSELS